MAKKAAKTVKTVKVLINDDGTVEFDQVGYRGKKCSGDIKDLIAAIGDEKKTTRKQEYYKDQEVTVKQRF
jgi:hypothetical protein